MALIAKKGRDINIYKKVMSIILEGIKGILGLIFTLLGLLVGLIFLPIYLSAFLFSIVLVLCGVAIVSFMYGMLFALIFYGISSIFHLDVLQIIAKVLHMNYDLMAAFYICWGLGFIYALISELSVSYSKRLETLESIVAGGGYRIKNDVGEDVETVTVYTAGGPKYIDPKTGKEYRYGSRGSYKRIYFPDDHP